MQRKTGWIEIEPGIDAAAAIKAAFGVGRVVIVDQPRRLNPLYSFRGCSNTPCASPPLSHIRYLPTRPLEFARPCGKRFDFDRSNSLGVSR